MRDWQREQREREIERRYVEKRDVALMAWWLVCYTALLLREQGSSSAAQGGVWGFVALLGLSVITIFAQGLVAAFLTLPLYVVLEMRQSSQARKRLRAEFAAEAGPRPEDEPGSGV